MRPSDFTRLSINGCESTLFFGIPEDTTISRQHRTRSLKLRSGSKSKERLSTRAIHHTQRHSEVKKADNFGVVEHFSNLELESGKAGGTFSTAFCFILQFQSSSELMDGRGAHTRAFLEVEA
ncbi:hypothetical protein JTB14_027356 [Gonioctena quinquepunctata]|nr:hypothetical protein JTB14_027356 [Gonioctena quinquepunctata]